MGGANFFLIPLSQEQIQVQYFHNPSSSAVLDIFSLFPNTPVSKTTFPSAGFPHSLLKLPWNQNSTFNLSARVGNPFDIHCRRHIFRWNNLGVVPGCTERTELLQNYSAAPVILPRWHWAVSAGERSFLPEQMWWLCEQPQPGPCAAHVAPAPGSCQSSGAG